jgi:16S rRNA (guanine966-N2)-methyltransferase
MPRPRSPAAPGQLRIIGGRWRGRRLQFPAVDGLRPTTDRTRETLFNWLSAPVPGSRCLDLFAGSGALGLEALSRGAMACVFVERSDSAATAINAHLGALDITGSSCIRADAAAWLRQGNRDAPFDIAFLDPPFDSSLLADCLPLLAAPGWLAAGAFVYLETARKAPQPQPPPGWELHREKFAGGTAYRLFRLP